VSRPGEVLRIYPQERYTVLRSCLDVVSDAEPLGIAVNHGSLQRSSRGTLAANVSYSQCTTIESVLFYSPPTSNVQRMMRPLCPVSLARAVSR
jgi:hypothetical protein